MANKRRRPIIYIAHQGGHDYSTAERLGSLTSVFDGTVNIFSVDRLLSQAKEELRGSQRGDFVLVGGSAVLNLIVTMLMMLKHGQLNMLLFNAKSRRYIVRTQTLAQYTNVIKDGGNNGGNQT